MKIAEENFNEDEKIIFPDIEDTADIIFTTGTTGASKGVELSHKALTAATENLISGFQYKPETLLIIPGPLNHSSAIKNFCASFANGSCAYIVNGLVDIKEFFKALDYPEGSKACNVSPSAIRTILQLTGNIIGKYKNVIDFIEVATAPLPETDKILLCQLLPNSRLYNRYGSTESSSSSILDFNKYPDKINCIGRPMINSKIFIVDENHNEIKSSKENPGLIACAGDVNMKGYINDPELTAKTLVNGVVYTNDLGYIDEEGFIYVTGRKDDVINVGGLKVAPTEVEDAALDYEGVEDCICIAVPDKITGSALKLLVVYKEGREFNPAEINSFLKKRLENYKVPNFYERVDKVARTFNGKINRKFYR